MRSRRTSASRWRRHRRSSTSRRPSGGRTVIGQATGILMERFDLPPDRAFSVLSRMSQQQNVKLRELAEQIVTTRTVPTT